MFGLVTRRELERALDARDEAWKRRVEELAFEWARWYDKFRSLYAMLLKREKKIVGEEEVASTSPDQERGPDGRPWSPPRFLSRRGF